MTSSAKHVLILAVLLWQCTDSARALAVAGGSFVSPSDPVAASTVAIMTYVDPTYGPGYCSGSLIADDMVVTAAHCLKSLEPDRHLIFGTDVSAKDVPTALFSGCAVPREFDAGEPHGVDHKDHHDFALIHFRAPLPAGYRKIKILSTRRFLKKGDPLTIAGYGIADDKDQGPVWNWGRLKKADANVGNPDYADTEVQVMTSRKAFPRNGDSGGPALYLSRGEYYLIGADNWGTSNRTFEVYADLRAFRQWITEASEHLRRTRFRAKEECQRY